MLPAPTSLLKTSRRDDCNDGHSPSSLGTADIAIAFLTAEAQSLPDRGQIRDAGPKLAGRLRYLGPTYDREKWHLAGPWDWRAAPRRSIVRFFLRFDKYSLAVRSLVGLRLAERQPERRRVVVLGCAAGQTDVADPPHGSNRVPAHRSQIGIPKSRLEERRYNQRPCLFAADPTRLSDASAIGCVRLGRLRLAQGTPEMGSRKDQTSPFWIAATVDGSAYLLHCDAAQRLLQFDAAEKGP